MSTVTFETPVKSPAGALYWKEIHSLRPLLYLVILLVFWQFVMLQLVPAGVLYRTFGSTSSPIIVPYIYSIGAVAILILDELYSRTGQWLGFLPVDRYRLGRVKLNVIFAGLVAVWASHLFLEVGSGNSFLSSDYRGSYWTEVSKLTIAVCQSVQLVVAIALVGLVWPRPIGAILGGLIAVAVVNAIVPYISDTHIFTRWFDQIPAGLSMFLQSTSHIVISTCSIAVAYGLLGPKIVRSAAHASGSLDDSGPTSIAWNPDVWWRRLRGHAERSEAATAQISVGSGRRTFLPSTALYWLTIHRHVIVLLASVVAIAAGVAVVIVSISGNSLEHLVFSLPAAILLGAALSADARDRRHARFLSDRGIGPAGVWFRTQAILILPLVLLPAALAAMYYFVDPRTNYPANADGLWRFKLAVLTPLLVYAVAQATSQWVNWYMFRWLLGAGLGVTAAWYYSLWFEMRYIDWWVYVVAFAALMLCTLVSMRRWMEGKRDRKFIGVHAASFAFVALIPLGGPIYAKLRFPDVTPTQSEEIAALMSETASMSPATGARVSFPYRFQPGGPLFRDLFNSTNRLQPQVSGPPGIYDAAAFIELTILSCERGLNGDKQIEGWLNLILDNAAAVVEASRTWKNLDALQQIDVLEIYLLGLMSDESAREKLADETAERLKKVLGQRDARRAARRAGITALLQEPADLPRQIYSLQMHYGWNVTAKRHFMRHVASRLLQIETAESWPELAKARQAYQQILPTRDSAWADSVATIGLLPRETYLRQCRRVNETDAGLPQFWNCDWERYAQELR